MKDWCDSALNRWLMQPSITSDLRKLSRVDWRWELEVKSTDLLSSIQHSNRSRVRWYTLAVSAEKSLFALYAFFITHSKTMNVSNYLLNKTALKMNNTNYVMMLTLQSCEICPLETGGIPQEYRNSGKYRENAGCILPQKHFCQTRKEKVSLLTWFHLWYIWLNDITHNFKPLTGSNKRKWNLTWNFYSRTHDSLLGPPVQRVTLKSTWLLRKWTVNQVAPLTFKLVTYKYRSTYI